MVDNLEDHLEIVEANYERTNILYPTKMFLSICLNHDGSKIVSGCNVLIRTFVCGTRLQAH